MFIVCLRTMVLIFFAHVFLQLQGTGLSSIDMKTVDQKSFAKALADDLEHDTPERVKAMLGAKIFLLMGDDVLGKNPSAEIDRRLTLLHTIMDQAAKILDSELYDEIDAIMHAPAAGRLDEAYAAYPDNVIIKFLYEQEKNNG